MTPPTCSDDGVIPPPEGDVQLEVLTQHGLQCLHRATVTHPHHTLYQWVGDEVRGGGGGGGEELGREFAQIGNDSIHYT